VECLGRVGIRRPVFSNGLYQLSPSRVVLRASADKITHIGRIALNEEILRNGGIVIGLPLLLQQLQNDAGIEQPAEPTHRHLTALRQRFSTQSPLRQMIEER
jgi:hypothetical protein